MRKIILIVGEKGLSTQSLGAFYVVEGDKPQDGFVEWLERTRPNYATWWDKWSEAGRASLLCTYMRSKGYEELRIESVTPNFYEVEQSLKPHRDEQEERKLLAELKARYEDPAANTSTARGR